MGPVRAAAVLLALLGAGTTAFVTVASGSDDPSADGDSRVTGSIDRPSTTSRAGERLTFGPESEAAGPSPRRPGTRSTPEPEPTDAADAADADPAEPTPTPTKVPTAAPEAAVSLTPAPAPSPVGTTTSDPAPEDHTAPETSLSEDYPDGRTAVFSLVADEPATFACSLDGGAWAACTSPTTYSDLESGWHDFAVRAVDETGNVDPTPAATSWQANGSPGSDD